MEQRSLRESDAEAGLALSREAGWNQKLEDWRFIICFGVALGGFVGGSLVATAATLPHSNRADWLAMVLVAQHARRNGYARQLVGDLINRSTAAGRGVGLDATAEGAPLYEGLGFRTIGALTRFRAETAPAPASLSTNAHPISAADIPAIKRFDREASGIERSEVLDHLLRRAPNAAFHVAGEKGTRGYVLVRDGDRSAHIGPLVADTFEDALFLLDTARAAIAGPAIIDAAHTHRDWTAALEVRGFHARRTFQRMRLGTSSAGLPKEVFAVAGPELG